MFPRREGGRRNQLQCDSCKPTADVGERDARCADGRVHDDGPAVAYGLQDYEVIELPMQDGWGSQLSQLCQLCANGTALKAKLYSALTEPVQRHSTLRDVES